jgi:cobalt-zinc-cadmium efflux system membrane fusion protein
MNVLKSLQALSTRTKVTVLAGLALSALAVFGLWSFLPLGAQKPLVQGVVAQDPFIIDLAGSGKDQAAHPWTVPVEPVAVKPFAETLRVTGKIDFDEQRVARIGATVTGRVTEILATPGEPVKRGNVLARIHSTELGQAQLAYLKARAADELAHNAFERARMLFKENVIAQADLQRRESEAGTAQAEQRAMADQLRVLGIPADQIDVLGRTGAVNSIAPVISSISGTVVERRIVQGQVVQPADALFTVADLSVVWVTAQVPEQEAYLLGLGQEMLIEVPGLKNRDFKGRLIYVGELVSADSRTVPARTSVDNADRQLKPGMMANMLIYGKPVDRPVIPASAVVREEGYDHVFVSESPTRFRLTVVKLGPESNGLRPVLSGVEPGTPIVTDQAYHLNNERKKRLGGG